MERGRRGLSALLILLFLWGCATTEHSQLKKPLEALKYEEVKEKIDQVYPELLLCYHSSLKGGEIFYGEANLTLIIDKNGKLKRFSWRPKPPERFYKCTEDVFAEVHFRKLPDRVRIEIPIKFTLEMEEKK